MANRQHWRNLAESMGLTWDDVCMEYERLRVYERIAREYKWSIRDSVCVRVGLGLGQYKMKHRKAFENGDCDQIPGFDVLAAGIAAEFPGFCRDDNPAEALWGLLCEPEDKLPPADETWSAAVDNCWQSVAETALN